MASSSTASLGTDNTDIAWFSVDGGPAKPLTLVQQRADWNFLCRVLDITQTAMPLFDGVVWSVGSSGLTRNQIAPGSTAEKPIQVTGLKLSTLHVHADQSLVPAAVGTCLPADCTCRLYLCAWA
jgi:hypothetical protein